MLWGTSSSAWASSARCSFSTDTAPLLYKSGDQFLGEEWIALCAAMHQFREVVCHAFDSGPRPEQRRSSVQRQRSQVDLVK